MSTVVNERDVLLKNASIRVRFPNEAEPKSKMLRIEAGTQAFIVDSTGVPFPPVINLSAVTANLTKPPSKANWEIIEGNATLQFSGDAPYLRFADMITDRVRIRCKVTESIDAPLDPTTKPAGQDSLPWKLIWNDEFGAAALNQQNWNLTWPWNQGSALDVNEPNWSVANGNLNIFATSNYKDRGISTSGKQEWAIGNGKFIECRMKWPKGKGILPRMYFRNTSGDSVLLYCEPTITDSLYTPSDPAETGTIRVAWFADQTTGGKLTTPAWATCDANLDSAYVVDGQWVEWNSLNRLRQGTYLPSNFSSQIAQSSADIVVISVGWSDYYEGRSLQNTLDDLSAMIDIIRNAGKFPLFECAHKTNDSQWFYYRDSWLQLCTQKEVWVIDQFWFTDQYMTSTGKNIFALTVDGNGYEPTQEFANAMGQYAAQRMKDIASMDGEFPKPSTGGTGGSSSGDGWSFDDFRPHDIDLDAYDQSAGFHLADFRIKQSVIAYSDAAHTFGISVTKDYLELLIDGVSKGKKAMAPGLDTAQMNWVGFQFFYSLAQNQLPNGTDTPVGVDNGMQIDYVRIFDYDGSGTTPAPGPSPSPAPGSAVPSVTAYANKGYQLVFRDEFDGSGLDTSKWNTHIWYVGEPDTVNYDVNNGGNSLLRIWPALNGSGQFFDRTIDTDGKYEFTYGIYEARMKLNRGRGCWPAFWLFAHPGSERIEIDIMEAYPGGGPDFGWGTSDLRPNNFAFTEHGRVGYEQYQVKLDRTIGTQLLDDGFDTYTLVWAKDRLEMYFNDQLMGTDYTSVFYSPMYILFDLWFGSASGSPNTSETPQGPSNAFEIDYIRVWALPNGQT